MLRNLTLTIIQSHTGQVLANAFQMMLKRHGLEHKVCLTFGSRVCCTLTISQMLAFNADNATSNNKQTVDLARKKNSFEECNHGRCFNHTVQLVAKALIKPFTACISSATTEDDDVASDDNMVEVEAVEDNDDDNTLWDKDDVSEAFDEVEDDDE